MMISHTNIKKTTTTSSTYIMQVAWDVYNKWRDDIRYFQLYPSELDMIIHKIASDINPNCAADDVNVFHFVELNQKQIVFCPTSKDAETEQKEGYMPFVWELVDKYLSNPNYSKTATLLMPLAFCRGYCNVDFLPRYHFVLLELDLARQTINIHDSQDDIRWFCYPDKLYQKLDEFNLKTQTKFSYDPYKNYHTYKVQLDKYSCGYFVIKYIEHIFNKGSSEGLEKIGLNDQGKVIGLKIKETYKSKSEFAERKYGISFTGETPKQDRKKADDIMNEFDTVEVSQTAIPKVSMLKGFSKFATATRTSYSSSPTNPSPLVSCSSST